MMHRRRFLLTSLAGVLVAPLAAEAQPAAKMYRIGGVLQGRPYQAAVDGLRDGLKALGLEEAKQYAKALGLTIPQAVLLQANQLIE